MPTNDFGFTVAEAPNLDPNKGVIKTVGDGNCGLRAAIQGLLIRGITQDKQAFVSKFLQGIYDRRKEASDAKGTDLYISNITKVTNPVNKQTQQNHVNYLLSNYNQLLPADLKTLRDNYIGENNKEGIIAKMDHVIYVLAGCLRLDISAYVNKKPYECLAFVGDDDGRTDLGRLGREIDFYTVLAYFADNQINITVESSEFAGSPPVNLKSIQNKLVNPNRFKEPEIDVSICHDGNHFDTIVQFDIDSISAAEALRNNQRRRSPSSVTSAFKEELSRIKDPFNHFEDQKNRFLAALYSGEETIYKTAEKDFVEAVLELAKLDNKALGNAFEFIDGIDLKEIGKSKEYFESLKKSIYNPVNNSVVSPLPKP